MPDAFLNRSPSRALFGDDDAATHARRVRIGGAIVRQFRMVEKALGGRLAAAPELSMLLDLYLAGLERRETCLWEVCNATSVPIATAHRKIGRLIDLGLVVRTGPSRDHRRIALELTPTGRDTLDALMDRLSQGFPAPATGGTSRR
jgi:DNA-binding MarR family transcriptional regulator